MRPRAATQALALGGLLALAACSSPPALEPPQAAHAAPQFLRDTAPAQWDAQWWQRMADPTLRQLLDEAQRGNVGVQQALSRVAQARAGATAQGSRLLPNVSLGATASDARSDLPEAVKRGQPDTRALRATLDLQWELDLFGAARAANRAAGHSVLEAEAGVRAARWLLSAEVAQHYLNWQAARLRAAQLQDLVAASQGVLEVAQSRLREGTGSALERDRAEADLRALQAQAPALRLLQQHSEHRLALLLGRPATAPVPALGQAPMALTVPPELPPGQPAELLLRRPDLQAAWARVEGARARADARAAERWPTLYLAGLLGRQDLRLNGADLSPVPFQNVALAFAMPLFNGGRLQAAADAASAQAQEAELAQQAAWLTALQEVESALAALQAARERERLSQQQVQALAALRLRALHLQHEGLVGRGPVLDATRAWHAAQLDHTQAQLATAQDAVQLAKALGGGWTLEKAP
jgi:NodT family efflux transporter outer membrane factor (OMF) lipoprotein